MSSFGFDEVESEGSQQLDYHEVSSQGKASFAVEFARSTLANGKVHIGTRGNNTRTDTSSIPRELDVHGLKPN